MTKLIVAAISDTHSQHHLLNIPEVDILVHTGDFTQSGTLEEASDFFQWFSKQPAKHKIVIAGNHDYLMEQRDDDSIREIVPSNITYLNDELVEIEGLRIWGSPVQPTYLNMAFNKMPGNEIKQHWNLIPSDIDILLTHGPAYGILDRTNSRVQVGCKDLRKAITAKKPRMHIFGHIHEDYGDLWHKGTLFINASSWNQSFDAATNPPVLFEIGAKDLVAQRVCR